MTRLSAMSFDHLHLACSPQSRLGVLLTPGGDLRLQRIGRGSFSVAYREVDGLGRAGRVFVFENQHTCDKEIAAEVHRLLPGNPHVPAVELFGHTRYCRVYTMPFYKTPLRAADSVRGWQDYQTMKTCFERRWLEFEDGTDTALNRAVVDEARVSGVSPAVIEALDAFAKTAAGFSDDYALDLVPWNLASDSRRRLVLLDVLFEREELEQRWRADDRAARARARRASRAGG